MRYADGKCTYTETINPHCYVFVGSCIMCDAAHTVSIPGKELYAYRQGAYIQTALKSVTADDREFLMSGVCPSCWTDMWREEC